MTHIAVKSIDHIVLNVTNVEESVSWYTKVLGMKHEIIEATENAPEKHILLFGDQKINLRPKDCSQVEWFTGKNIESGTADLCFLVTGSPEEVVTHLNLHEIHIECGPVIKLGALGKIRSVYCRDPDGSLIELSSYPSS